MKNTKSPPVKNLKGGNDWNSLPNEEKEHLKKLLKTGQLSNTEIKKIFPNYNSNNNNITTNIMNYYDECNSIEKKINKTIGDNEVIVILPIHGNVNGIAKLSENTQLIYFSNINARTDSRGFEIYKNIIQDSYKMHGYLLDDNGCKSDTLELYIKMLINEYNKVSSKINSNNQSLNSDYYDTYKLNAIDKLTNTLASIHLNKRNSTINNPVYLITSEFNTILYFIKNQPYILYKIEIEVNENPKENKYTINQIEDIIRTNIIDQNILNGETCFLTIISLSCRDIIKSKIPIARKLSKNLSNKYFINRLKQPKLPYNNNEILYEIATTNYNIPIMPTNSMIKNTAALANRIYKLNNSKKQTKIQIAMKKILKNKFYKKMSQIIYFNIFKFINENLTQYYDKWLLKQQATASRKRIVT
jgi:hypothetical protein